MKPKSAITYGEPITPKPLPDEYIQSLENAGARPELIAALRRDQKSFRDREKEQTRRRTKLKEITDYYMNLEEMPKVELVKSTFIESSFWSGFYAGMIFVIIGLVGVAAFFVGAF